MKTNQVIDIISAIFILLFLYAAANKLIDHQKFEVQIGQSPILTGYAAVISWIIPATEIFISILLIIPSARQWGLLASFSLMLMFTAYIIVILNFAERIPCSCGGILEKMGWTAHLIFNICFVLLALTGVFLEAKNRLQSQG